MKVFSPEQSKGVDTEVIFRLCARLFYVCASHGIAIPSRLVAYLPSFGVLWDKVHLGKVPATISGLHSLTDRLWNEGKNQGSVTDAFTETKNILEELFLKHIVRYRYVDKDALSDLIMFEMSDALVRGGVFYGEDILRVSDEDIKNYMLPAASPVLEVLYDDNIWPGIHIFAANPGEGKTTLMVHFMLKYAERGIPVIFVQTELSDVVFTMRFKDVLEAKRDVLGNIVIMFGGLNVSQIEGVIQERGFSRPPLVIVDIPDVLIGLYDDPRQSLNYVYSMLVRLCADKIVSSVFATSHLVRGKHDGDRLAETSFKNRVAASVVEFSSDVNPLNNDTRLLRVVLKKHRYGPSKREASFVMDMRTLDISPFEEGMEVM